MATWFECKIKYDETLEDGKIKNLPHVYMVDALTFSEAERRLLEEVQPFISGDYVITDIKKAKIAELMTSNDGNDDRWYKARVDFVELDEKTAVERKTTATMLVQARDLNTAIQNHKKGMAGTMSDWNLVSMTETKILDVFPYEKKD